MGKYLPIIIPVAVAFLILLFAFLYLQAGKTSKERGNSSFQIGKNDPKEVPKNLPDSLRVENLEGSVSSLLDQLNGLKSAIATASAETQSSALVEYRLKALEASTLELKSRVASLEKPVSTLSSTTAKPPLYIPLGGYNESNDQAWLTIVPYTIVLDPADYPGISNVSLEIVMKLNQASGTGYARIINSTDNVPFTNEVSTTSDKYSLLASTGFALASGKKTYQLQLKSPTGTVITVQSARLKINFQ